MTKVKTKTVYKVKWKNLFSFILILAFSISLILLIIYLINVYNDYKDTKEMVSLIDSKVKITNIVDDDDTTIIEQDDEISKFDSYWNYIKLSLIEVDMASLKKINSEAIGWIEVKGTDVSYPVVQSKDNGYYMNHSFDKTSNRNGWIYLDHRNDISELDENTIIYGNYSHLNLLLNDLKTVFKSSWKSNENNYIIKYYTNNYTTLWQIVSVYKTEKSDYLKINFENEEDFSKYISEIIDKSEIDFNANIANTDKLITLTTNSDSENIVVQAKLIKIKKYTDD